MGFEKLRSDSLLLSVDTVSERRVPPLFVGTVRRLGHCLGVLVPGVNDDVNEDVAQLAGLYVALPQCRHRIEPMSAAVWAFEARYLDNDQLRIIGPERGSTVDIHVAYRRARALLSLARDRHQPFEFALCRIGPRFVDFM
jgi:hypothetical protein